MSQPIAPAPKVNANIKGTVHQVNLRDYLNVRVAPFLKKAIHESLQAEAQYPLQWLGEHLIQQSILFEGNPDATGLRERFVYNHDPKPLKPQGETLPAQAQVQAEQPQQTIPAASNSMAQGLQQSAAPSVSTNDGVGHDTLREPPSAHVPLDSSSSAAHGVNGAVHPSGTPVMSEQQPTTQDTEMTNAP